MLRAARYNLALMAPPAREPAPTLSVGEELALWAGWCGRHPATIALVSASLAVLLYFFGLYKAFINGAKTTAEWAWEAWNPENNQEHSMLILPIAIFLVWYHRRKIQEARKTPSNAGLLYLLAGIVTFIVAVRCLQPRFAICALPLIIYGSVRFVWGREVGRVFIFPCLFLLFMVPVGGLVQGTVTLQLMVSAATSFLASLVGVQVEVIGTSMKALDGSFNFEIAEGCSGIRSLMAMTTLAALYVHFTQKEAWKQIVIFAGSVVFALIGNVGRIFTVILVARFISPTFASGLYHDYSGFIFFPFAVAAMVSFSQLVNLRWSDVASEALKPEAPAAKKSAGPISYDY